MLADDELVQDQHWRDDAMLQEENHLRGATHVARYQQALCGYHGRMFHAWCFEEGDIVLTHVESATIPWWFW